jgi:hypothetical protein
MKHKIQNLLYTVSHSPSKLSNHFNYSNFFSLLFFHFKGAWGQYTENEIAPTAGLSKTVRSKKPRNPLADSPREKQ